MTLLAYIPYAVTAMAIFLYIATLKHISPLLVVDHLLNRVYNADVESRLLLGMILTVIAFVQMSLASRTFTEAEIADMQSVVYVFGFYEILVMLIISYYFVPLWRDAFMLTVTWIFKPERVRTGEYFK